MSELATILEHETMDFTSPPETRQNMLPSCEDENDPQEEAEDQCENLHSLSL